MLRRTGDECHLHLKRLPTLASFHKQVPVQDSFTDAQARSIEQERTAQKLKEKIPLLDSRSKDFKTYPSSMFGSFLFILRQENISDGLTSSQNN